MAGPAGVPTLEALIGRTDLLELPARRNSQRSRASSTAPDPAQIGGKPRTAGVLPGGIQRAVRPRRKGRDDAGGHTCRPSRQSSGGEFAFQVTNCDRSIGARLSGEIARRRHGNMVWNLPRGIAPDGVPRARVLACGTPAACICTWKEIPTITWARAWPAASWLFTHREQPVQLQRYGDHRQHLPVWRHRWSPVRPVSPVNGSAYATAARTP